MPTIWYEQGFRFSFYSADWQEPPHVHVTKGKGGAKWWLQEVREQWSRGFTTSERGAIRRIILANRIAMLQRWHEVFPPDEGRGAGGGGEGH